MMRLSGSRQLSMVCVSVLQIPVDDKIIILVTLHHHSLVGKNHHKLAYGSITEKLVHSTKENTVCVSMLQIPVDDRIIILL